MTAGTMDCSCARRAARSCSSLLHPTLSLLRGGSLQTDCLERAGAKHCSLEGDSGSALSYCVPSGCSPTPYGTISHAVDAEVVAGIKASVQFLVIVQDEVC